MAEVVLFHAVLGLRSGVTVFADRLRDEGHRLHTPDLYDRETFSGYEEGRRKRDALGIATTFRRAGDAVADRPAGLVFAGFSMGAACAEHLAAVRPGALAAVLMHGAVPLEALDIPRWPAGVPVQVHYAIKDPLVDADDLAALGDAVRHAGVDFELYTYPGSGHLFAEPELAEHDPAAAALMSERVLELLDRIDHGRGER
jgi:dienelactone hydrolase